MLPSFPSLQAFHPPLLISSTFFYPSFSLSIFVFPLHRLNTSRVISLSFSLSLPPIPERHPYFLCLHPPFSMSHTVPFNESIRSPLSPFSHSLTYLFMISHLHLYHFLISSLSFPPFLPFNSQYLHRHNFNPLTPSFRSFFLIVRIFFNYDF